MKIFNITTKKVYQKNGEEKASWLQVGRLVRFDATEDKLAQMKIELNMFPQTAFYVFEQKEGQATATAPKKAEVSEPSADEIPF